MSHYEPDCSMPRTTLEIAKELHHTIRQRFLAAFDRAPIVVALMQGPDFIIEYTNELYQTITGKSQKELEGVALFQAFPDLCDEIKEIYWEVMSSGRAITLSSFAIRLDYDQAGQAYEKFWDLHYYPIKDLEGQYEGILLCAYDTSEKVEYKKAVEKYQNEKYFREKLVAMLMHDLRNPITSINIASSLLQRQLASCPDAIRLLTLIDKNAARANNLVQKILDTNLIEAGEKLTVNTSELDLVEVITKALEGLSNVYGDRFHFEYSENPLPGKWDRCCLERILENLCSNAIKYGEAGQPVTIRLESNASTVTIAVHNQGKAIPEDEQKWIFEPYTRTIVAKKSGKLGWGFGLAIVKGMAESHGGQVRVVSSDNEGTTFFVELPRWYA